MKRPIDYNTATPEEINDDAMLAYDTFEKRVARDCKNPVWVHKSHPNHPFDTSSNHDLSCVLQDAIASGFLVTFIENIMSIERTDTGVWDICLEFQGDFDKFGIVLFHFVSWNRKS